MMRPDVERRVNDSLPILQQFSIVYGDDFAVSTNGETSVALLVDSPNPVVAKLPLPAVDGYRGVIFESLITGELEEGSFEPVAVPKIVDCRDEWPQHAIFTKAVGVVLPNETVRQFSKAEKQALGTRIGEFVACLSTTISVDRYKEIASEVPGLVLPDRIHNIRRYAREAVDCDTMDDTLAEVLVETYLEYKNLVRDGLLTPSIVGHDDLRVANMTFAKQNGLRQLKGVFDFAHTRLSSPERELRHAVALGEDVAETAIAGYEVATAQPISRRVLGFWAVGQAASACAALVNVKEGIQAQERLNDLQYLLPEKDWSALESRIQILSGNQADELGLVNDMTPQR